MNAHCRSTDHDGAIVPATRSVSSVKTTGFGGRRHVHRLLCAWCAEGHVAVMLRDGYTVTIEPLTADVPNVATAAGTTGGSQ